MLTEGFSSGSQRERVSMLRIVLAEKGVLMSAHYGPVGAQPGRTASGDTTSQTPRDSDSTRPTAAQNMDGPAPATRDGEEGGIFL